MENANGVSTVRVLLQPNPGDLIHTFKVLAVP
jgi:hypothetical protein